MRVIIFDDGYHDEITIDEVGGRSEPKILMKELGKPHSDLIQIKNAYIGDITYYYNERYPNFRYDYCEAKVEKIFCDVQNDSIKDNRAFRFLFNILWSMIPDS